MIEFPSWWTQADVDAQTKIEDTCIALFEPLLPSTEMRYWLDTDEQTQQILFEEGRSYLRIVRLGGEVEADEKRDIHRVQFAAASANRDEAWDILAFVQRVLYAYGSTSYVLMPSGKRQAMEFLGETLGPLLDPQQIRDERLVPVTVRLGTPWPKGVHDKIKRELGL